MSLSDKLSAAQAEAATPGIKPCLVGRLLVGGSSLSPDDLAKLTEVINVPEGTPGRLKNTEIVLALRSEGIDLSFTAMDRHRAQTCNCYRAARN